MKQKLCDATITFSDVGSATIRDLTQEQVWAVQDALRLIEQKPPRYAENGVLLYSVSTADRRQATTESSGFLARLMRRFNAWMTGGLLILFLALSLILPASVTAQDRKTRVAVVAQDGELAKLVRDELTNSNVVVTAAKRGDYVVTLALTPIGEDVGCRGFFGVLLIEGRDTKQLSAFIASDLGALARQMAQGFNKELKGK